MAFKGKRGSVLSAIQELPSAFIFDSSDDPSSSEWTGAQPGACLSDASSKTITARAASSYLCECRVIQFFAPALRTMPVFLWKLPYSTLLCFEHALPLVL